MRTLTKVAAVTAVLATFASAQAQDYDSDSIEKEAQARQAEDDKTYLAILQSFQKSNPTAAAYVNEIDSKMYSAGVAWISQKAAENKQYSNGVAATFSVYDQAARVPNYTSSFLFWLLNDYNRRTSIWASPISTSRAIVEMKEEKAARDATVRLSLLQAAQNRRIIEQNDRIIALLEKIAAKK